MSIISKVIFGIKSSLGELGLTVNTSEEMSAALSRWRTMYKDTGSLALASSIASEVARLVTSEMKSEISGSKRAEFLNKSYQKLLGNIRNITELACADGGIVFKPYVKDGEIKISVIRADSFIPTDFDENGEITGGVFLDRYYSGKKVYTRLEEHTITKNEYTIRNHTYISDNSLSIGRPISIKETGIWSDIKPSVTISGVKNPLFAYFKMPMANYIDASSPLGISVFARAQELIRDAEEQYKRLLWEFESGERALFVDESAMRRDEHGVCEIPDKRLYRLLNSGDDNLFADWSPNMRDESIINCLNEILRRIEFNSGLAYGTLSDVASVDKTAEEIRVSKQRSYALVCEIQNSLKTALLNLAAAMDTIADLYELCPEGEYSLTAGFDDSVVADKQAEFTERMDMCRSGIIEPWEVRAWYFGEEEERARKRVAAATPKGEE